MDDVYLADPMRYDTMEYARCGASGLGLPRLALGLWHNFGEAEPWENQRALLRHAFDLGITHFDLANNYGPPYGRAEENFGRHLNVDFRRYRDELIIATKAGYDMWPGPYGDGGSRKYLLASLDQSLRRMGLEYVDIYYHHRPDPHTPLEETMGALAQAVRAGKALHVAISNYPAERTRQAAKILAALGTPLLIHQPRYNMLDRGIEAELLPALRELGVGCIPFSPLAQGLLTNRYLGGIPEDSRVGKGSRFLTPERLQPEVLAKIRTLHEVAKARGSTLAQLAIRWILERPEVTTVLIGASRPAQLDDLVDGLGTPPLSEIEKARIEAVLAGRG